MLTSETAVLFKNVWKTGRGIKAISLKHKYGL